jgi:hypothetical protein
MSPDPQAAAEFMEAWAAELAAAGWSEPERYEPTTLQLAMNGWSRPQAPNAPTRSARSMTDPQGRVVATIEAETGDPYASLIEVRPLEIVEGRRSVWWVSAVGPLPAALLAAVAEAAAAPAAPGPEAFAEHLERDGRWFLEGQDYDEERNLIERRWSTYAKDCDCGFAAPGEENGPHAGWTVSREDPDAPDRSRQRIDLPAHTPAAVVAAVALAAIPAPAAEPV